MDKKTIQKGLRAIAKVDSDIAEQLQVMGYPQPRIRPQGFETLLSIIVSQQLSTHAADAIMNRLREAMPSMQASGMLELDAKTLKSLGLSRQKIDYVSSLAQKIVDGDFIPEQIQGLTEEEAIKEIVALRGLGRWSAEIYLMFSLQRTDVFPADDLAIQVALQKLKKLPEKPTPKAARDLVVHWAPWRSAGSLFLWHYYKGAPA